MLFIGPRDAHRMGSGRWDCVCFGCSGMEFSGFPRLVCSSRDIIENDARSRGFMGVIRCLLGDFVYLWIEIGALRSIKSRKN